ncbi:MAG: DNA repair protein RecO C-terminal domain-containing protein [SAR324 cluster bacterium]|nr:DNA repair protein RecO C-terminal domain-containing protein [SAR324 cluster bacterium]
MNLLSSQNGKLSAVIYKGRKIGKSSSFLFQPGDLLDVEYQIKESDDFVKIANISGNRVLNATDFTYQRFLFHSYLLEIISKISQPGNPSSELFQILADNNRCSWKASRTLFFIAQFIWQLIQHSGYGVDYHSCRNCHRETWRFNQEKEPVFRKEHYNFHTNSGTLICNSCNPVDTFEGTITSAVLKVMWIMDESETNQLPQVDIPDSVLVDFITCLNPYLLQRYGIRPNSLPLFLNSMNYPAASGRGIL